MMVRSLTDCHDNHYIRKLLTPLQNNVSKPVWPDPEPPAVRESFESQARLYEHQARQILPSSWTTGRPARKR